MGADPGSMAVKAALMAAQMALTMTQKIEGPRLDSLDVTTADYGTPLVRFWGKRRLEGVPIIWAERLREKKTTSKTKGGKYSEYKYFGTFAVAIADHEIDSISRLWMDKHLVYDLTDTGPISVLGGLFEGLGRPVKLSNGKNMRIYLGTETQEADPRMEAWCEDRYGADSCPAYRGVSYIVFEDLPLEKFGNRIPQVTVEAINNSTPNYLWEELDVSGDAFEEGFQLSADYGRFTFNSYIYDTATKTEIAPLSFEPSAIGVGKLYLLEDGIGAGGGPYLTVFSGDGTTSTLPIVCPNPAGDLLAFPDALGADMVFMKPFAGAGTTIQYLSGGEVLALDIGFAATTFEQDPDGNVWAAGTDGGDGIYLRCIAGLRLGENCFVSTASSSFVNLYINSSSEFILFQGAPASAAYRLANDFTPLLTGSAIGGNRSYQRGSDSLWSLGGGGIVEYSLKTLEVVRTLTTGLWSGSPGTVTDGVYDPINHAALSNPTSTKLVWRYIDRVGSPGVDLGDVVSEVASWCGVESVDVSDLTQVVAGYSVVQGSGKDMLSPLLDIHDVDARPHDFSVQFITRGDTAAGTIPVTEFVREGDEPRYQITIKQDTDLPRKVSLSFADDNKDQQKNTVIFQRPSASVDCVRELTIDLSTYVAVPGDAQKFTDRYGRRQWIGREQVTNALTAQYLKLEPGDVWNLQLDDVTQTHRLEKLTLSQGRLNAEWVRDFPSVAVLGTGEGAPMDGRDDDVIYVPAPTKGFVLDIPLVQDSHDLTVPQLYYAAGDYGSGDWPGASIYRADPDLNEYFAWNGVEAADKAVWGYATDALGDCDPWVWDRGNSVNVSAKGTLTSTTEATINTSPLTNLAYLGGELLNFVTATLEADGTYTLSGLRRGRRGTEWACSTHAAGDEFILVSSLAREGMGLSDVGQDLGFKAQTIGRDIASAAIIEVDYTGATLKPWAPARVKAVFDGTDWTFTVTRRNRLGATGFTPSPIAQSETSEAYSIDIYDGADVVRTLTLTGTNVATWTNAQQVTDFGSTQTTKPELMAYQISATVGRGFALAA